MNKKYKDSEELKAQIVEAVNSTITMAQAAEKVGMAFSTFKRWAIKYEVYKPNQAGIGVSKNRPNTVEIENIFAGLHSNYNTNQLRKRLIKEGIKQYICENCGLTEWLGQPIPLELDHIDGDSTNHSLENLKILCPNCHALTPTYRGKNIGKNK